MKVTKKSSFESVAGPAEIFTGRVRIDSPFAAEEPAKVSGGHVTFEPGARTAWHTHPLGQTLIVTGGRGWVQKEGEERQAIEPGDIVWIAPGEKHWHGASEKSFMSHIAIQESQNGTPVTWLEHVSDQDYGAQA